MSNEIKKTIAHLESQRDILGDAAIEGLRQKLSDDEAGISLAGERKLVTIMFADISGFCGQ